MISIIDYGAGNIAALENAFDYLGFECEIATEPTQVLSASKIILPGVGAFDPAVKNLRARGLFHSIKEAVFERKTPILGVCLGMQLLGKSSEEGTEKGLGLVDARTISLRHISSDVKIPNMGWLPVSCSDGSTLMDTCDNTTRFYFAHSYYVECLDSGDVAASAIYGAEIPVAIERDNIFGVQFHPEKSHRFGLSLLSKFAMF